MNEHETEKTIPESLEVQVSNSYGRPKKFNANDIPTIGKLLSLTNGNVSQVAKQLKCAYDTLRNFIIDNPEIQNYIIDGNNQIVDEAEQIYFREMRGHPEVLNDKGEKVQEFSPARAELAWKIMETKGSNRGYSQKINIKSKMTADELLDELDKIPDDILAAAIARRQPKKEAKQLSN